MSHTTHLTHMGSTFPLPLPLPLPVSERQQAGSPAGSRAQASAQDPSPGHPPAERHQRLLRPKQGEPPVSDATPQTISDSDVEFRDTKCVYFVHKYNFLYQHWCVCLCVSVPIIATAVQEELETGSASSGDASCATSTVKLTSDDLTTQLYFISASVINNKKGFQIEWFQNKSGCVFPPQAEKHHPALVKVLCSELGVEPEALLDFELCLTDTQPAVSLNINRWLPVTEVRSVCPPVD